MRDYVASMVESGVLEVPSGEEPEAKDPLTGLFHPRYEGINLLFSNSLQKGHEWAHSAVW